MKVGDLVYISAYHLPQYKAIGLYIGLSIGSHTEQEVYHFWWKGRVATFDKPYWKFQIINLEEDSNEGW